MDRVTEVVFPSVLLMLEVTFAEMISDAPSSEPIAASRLCESVAVMGF
jgi:hypothetical protein